MPIVICLGLLSSLITADEKNQDLDLNPIVASIKNTSNSENISNGELEKAYIAYRAAYNYGRLLKFEGTDDFGVLFDKMRLITGRLSYVKNDKLSDATYEVLKKYESLPFDDLNKAEFLDDCYYISVGLEKAMD